MCADGSMLSIAAAVAAVAIAADVVVINLQKLARTIFFSRADRGIQMHKMRYKRKFSILDIFDDREGKPF